MVYQAAVLMSLFADTADGLWPARARVRQLAEFVSDHSGSWREPTELNVVITPRPTEELQSSRGGTPTGAFLEWHGCTTKSAGCNGVNYGYARFIDQRARGQVQVTLVVAGVLFGVAGSVVGNWLTPSKQASRRGSWPPPPPGSHRG